jgi:hypothetical protein
MAVAAFVTYGKAVLTSAGLASLILSMQENSINMSDGKFKWTDSHDQLTIVFDAEESPFYDFAHGDVTKYAVDKAEYDKCHRFKTIEIICNSREFIRDL